MMTKAKKHEINALARIFYKMHGFDSPEGYDFSTATHPQEKGMFNLAQAAREFYSERVSKRRDRKTASARKVG